VPISAQAVTDSGFPWLSALPLHATTPATLSIGYLASSLAPGSYTGRVIVTTDTQAMLTIFVTLEVVTDNISLKVAPASLAFTATPGSPDAPAQSLAVTVAGANAYFQAKVTSAPPNGKWLAVTSAGLTPATLAVAVTAKDLPAGVYQGVIALTPNGATTGTVTVNVTLTVQAQKPAINPTGIVNAAGLGNAISPGTWVSLFGTSLSATTRAWRDSDFTNGNLPTSLDGVTVTINGKFAAVSYISAQQINVLAPDDTSTGLVPVLVKNSLGVSDSVLTLQQTLSPALFQKSANSVNYVAGAHLDGSYVAGDELVKAGIPGSPAKAGETIVLFGTGFGTTQPSSPATAPVSAPLPLAHPEDLRIRIGGVDAAIIYAGLISPGVYQFNLVVPPVSAGDKPVVAELRGLLSQTAILPVQ